MEVAGLVISAVGFVDLGIRSGSTLAKVFRNCGDAGKQMSNTTERLEAQKFTLELWERRWQEKARQQHNTTLEDGYRQVWGEEGEVIIVKCLAQLNVKFGEAFRTLRSIDPDSFGNTSSASASSTNADREQSLASSSFRLAVPNTNPRSSSPSGHSTSGTDSPATPESGKDQEGKNRRWYKRLSPSDPQALWGKKRPSSISSVAAEPTTPNEQTELAQQALQQRLSPGAKFQWSVSRKEYIRTLVNDIDDLLALLETLATQCEAEQSMNKGQIVNSSRGIRAAAKALYTALHDDPSGPDLDFKLEKERADPGYFEQVVGPLEYLDQSDRSFKFPLLVSSNQCGDEPFLLLAEAIYPSVIVQPVPLLNEETPLGEIVKTLRSRPPNCQNAATPLLFRSQHTTIVIHGITTASTTSPNLQEAFLKCSFTELLHAEAGVDPLVAHWKRLQLACIIAISVLHLYETGWISEQLETNDFYFFGSADSQYHERNGIAPYVSALPSKHSLETTPFDCLKQNQMPSNLLGSRDERLATLFHRLGIVLFELGRGVQHRDIFKGASPSESEVLAEIERIPFGRPYRDLVRVCLTGSLYAGSAINIDSHFDRVVIEKYICSYGLRVTYTDEVVPG
jgi:hypothetical protein